MPRQHINHGRRTYVPPDDFPQRLELVKETSGLTRLAVSRTALSGALPQGLVNNTVMQYLHFGGTNLCGPSDEAFQEWLDGVSDNNGPNSE